MNFDFQQHIPQEFHDTSRVWIYQSNRLFTMNEAFEIEPLLHDFVNDWKSHGTLVKGFANLLFGQFIIVMADETATGVSGCSTDSSVHLIKEIEQRFKVNMFDRQLLAFIVKNKIQMLPMTHIKHAFENNFITPETLYFNNLLLTKKELLEKWIIPVKESWLAAKFYKNIPVQQH